MPYTLTKGLLWFAIALVVGIVIGWLLRSIRATRQLRAARHARHDAAELERARARLAVLEPLVGQHAPTAALPDDAVDSGAEAAIDGRVPSDPLPTERAEPAEHAAPTGAEQVRSDVGLGEPAGAHGDDLTEIDGIDADVAALCGNIGITTWAELAATEPSLLRTMLADAGPTLAGRDPETWPAQAALLAAGRRAELARFVERGGGEPEE